MDEESSAGAEFTMFYTVQDPADVARLRSSGEPWPIAPERASVGEGVYAWGSRAEAEAYRTLLRATASGQADLEMIAFQVSNADLRSLRQLDRTLLSGEQDENWLNRYSSLWGGTPDHGLEYIKRGTRFGVEHFFHKSVFRLLHFME